MSKSAAYSATTTKHPRMHDVKIKMMPVIAGERGYLQESLRANDRELFSTLGQVHGSATGPGVVKAWHYGTYYAAPYKNRS